MGKVGRHRADGGEWRRGLAASTLHAPWLLSFCNARGAPTDRDAALALSWRNQPGLSRGTHWAKLGSADGSVGTRALQASHQPVASQALAGLNSQVLRDCGVSLNPASLPAVACLTNTGCRQAEVGWDCTTLTNKTLCLQQVWEVCGRGCLAGMTGSSAALHTGTKLTTAQAASMCGPL